MNAPHVILYAAHHEGAGQEIPYFFSLGGELLVQRLLRQCNEAGFYSIQILYSAATSTIAEVVGAYLPSVICTPIPAFQGAEATNCPEQPKKKESMLWCSADTMHKGVLFVDAGCAVSEQFFLMLRKHIMGLSFYVEVLSSIDTSAMKNTADNTKAGAANLLQQNVCALYLSSGDIPESLYSFCASAPCVSSLAMQLQHHGVILPAKQMMIPLNEGVSCHSAAGYRVAQYLLENRGVCSADAVVLLDVSGLRRTEEHDPVRVDWLMNKIMKEKIWTQPLCVAADQGFVMDGHHRFAVAKKMGLSKVPAIVFSYRDVAVWSLRPALFAITKERFLASIAAGKVYPYKTVKHHFPESIPSISILLAALQ